MHRATPHVREYPVAPDLTPFIHRVMHGVCEEPGELRIPPTGGVFLSYVPGSPLTVHFNNRVYARKPRYFLGGQLRGERPILRSDGRFELIGVEFTPTGYYRLLHRSARPLTDSIADLADTHPQIALTLDQQLHSRPATPEHMIADIETVLRQRVPEAREAPMVSSMVSEIVRQNGIVRIGELCAPHPVTDRQLRRYFEEVVGIPAKHFAKICQVNAVVSAMLGNNWEQLQYLALDHGFYDQAHFIRDFQAFVAMDPTAFLQNGSQFLRTYLGNASRESRRAEPDHR